MDKMIFTTYEVAKICNVHQTTIINWIDENKLRAYVTPGGHRRIKKSSLLEFLKQYQMPIPENLMKQGIEVLVVDDDLQMLEEFKQALSGHGFSLDFASSGFEAARKIYSKKPDLILLDFRMPGMDGFQVCDTLKRDKATADIPVFAVTVLKSDDDRARIQKCGVVEYIQKPVDIDKLLSLIQQTLEIESVRSNDMN